MKSSMLNVFSSMLYQQEELGEVRLRSAAEEFIRIYVPTSGMEMYTGCIRRINNFVRCAVEKHLTVCVD